MISLSYTVTMDKNGKLPPKRNGGTRNGGSVLKKSDRAADCHDIEARKLLVMNGWRYWVALVLIGGFVGGTTVQSQAAPVLTNAVAIRSAVPSLATDVRHHGYVPPSLREHLRAVGWIGLVILVFSGGAWFGVVGFNLAGQSWEALIEQSILSNLLLETRFGYSVLVRVALAAALAMCLVRLLPKKRSRWDLPVATVLSVCLAASLAWSGHGSSGTGAFEDIPLGADAIHSIAAVAWVGGLLFLVLLLACSRRLNSEPARALAAQVISASKRSRWMAWLEDHINGDTCAQRREPPGSTI
jgi:hypothetical protein